MNEFNISNVDLLLYFGATLMALSYAIVSLHVFIKLIGFKNKIVSISHNFISFTNLFNRFLYAFSFLAFSFAADLGFSDFHLKIALIWFAFFSFVLHGAMFLWKEWISTSLEFLLGLYSVRGIPGIQVGYDLMGFKALFLPTIIMVLFLSSFSIPMLFVSSFPEFRATILQVSSIINAVGSILNIYFVEKRIAELIDHEEDYDVILYSMNIIVSRSIACLILFLSFSIFVLGLNQ